MERTNPLKSLFAVALHFSSYANMNMSKAQNLFAVFNEKLPVSRIYSLLVPFR